MDTPTVLIFTGLLPNMKTAYPASHEENWVILGRREMTPSELHFREMWQVDIQKEEGPTGVGKTAQASVSLY